MDVFTWSLPFVGEKITDMLLAILNTCSKEELEEDDDVVIGGATDQGLIGEASSPSVPEITMAEAEAETVAPTAETAATPVSPTAFAPTSPTVSSPTTPIAFDAGQDPVVNAENAANAERIKREKEASKNRIRQKILAVGRISRVFAVLRQESESVSELKDLMGTTKLPYGSLVLGAEGLKSAIHSFDDAKMSDIDNERMPPSKEEKTKEDKDKIIKAIGEAQNTPQKELEEIEAMKMDEYKRLSLTGPVVIPQE